MGYAHIDNLYKNQNILLFRECYALEKVHGSSAHVAFNDGEVRFFAGGESHERFVKLFDAEALAAKFAALGHPKIVVHGEVYGGKCQGMRATYGENLAFIAFDVRIGDAWLTVPVAEEISVGLGLEFVPYAKVPTDVAALDTERDRDSIVAWRRGCGMGKKREGVVLRPLVEVTLNNRERVCAKHKRGDFAERQSPPKVVDPALLGVLTAADAIAEEWVTPMRLEHVLQKLPAPHEMTLMPKVLGAMVEDVFREAKGEIVESKEAAKAISKKAAALFKKRVEAVNP
jgi:hypothetical protein